MRRTVGLQAELIITTAMLVGAALLFGGFLLLRLTEQSLVEQQYKQIRSTIQLVGRSLSPTEHSDFEIDPGKIELLLTGIDLDLQGWELYNRSMQPVGSHALSVQAGRRPALLVQQARLSSAPQLQIDYPSNWLPFIDHSSGSIKAAISIYDSDRLFAGVIFLQFSLVDVHDQVSATRQMVLIYVFLYGLVLTGFGVVVLSRNVVRPVNLLNEATASVASGDLDTHVMVDGPREISDLGQSFNRMTEALRNGRDELLRSERMASVGHLSAGMAHEIGNPLAAIIGYLEMLKVDINHADQRDLVCRSLDEASRIDRLVRDLLDYAAPIGVLADPVDPCSIIMTTVTSLQGQIVFDGYFLKVICPEELPDICINPHKLTQVLVNLITNARDACEIGGTITISATKIEGEVRISVQDKGTGIDAKTRAQIFDPFFSTKPEGEGRGLGLTICHRIIEEAGGWIQVDSDAQTGTTFIVCLPSIDGT